MRILLIIVAIPAGFYLPFAVYGILRALGKFETLPGPNRMGEGTTWRSNRSQARARVAELDRLTKRYPEWDFERNQPCQKSP